VTVIVGQGSDSVEVDFPKPLLCSRPAWFDKAFREGGFAEAAAGRIRLQDDSPKAFMAFEYYVYFNDIAYIDLTSLPDQDETQWSEHLEHCFEVWVLGDKYHMPGSQNAAMLRASEVLNRDNHVEITDETHTLCF